MHTDPLKQALADMETAWRRLREVLDGPDVAAALVERQAGPHHMADAPTVQPMSTAPRDGTWIHMHFDGLYRTQVYCRVTFEGGPMRWGTGPSFNHNLSDRAVLAAIGWSPVK